MKMRKTTLLMLVIIASIFTSCKKTYSCSCSSSFSVGAEAFNTVKTDTYSEKMKEKQAKAACKDTETKLLYTNFLLAEFISATYGIDSYAVTTCSIK